MPYSEAAAQLTALSGKLNELRSRYKNAWGDDSTGDQARPQVEAALKQMRDQLDARARRSAKTTKGSRARARRTGRRTAPRATPVGSSPAEWNGSTST